jgi:hypothetical protein
MTFCPGARSDDLVVPTVEDLPALPSGALKVALVVVVALGAAEQLRHVRRRFRRAANEWWIDVGHRERDQMLRRALGAVAVGLMLVAAKPRRP